MRLSGLEKDGQKLLDFNNRVDVIFVFFEYDRTDYSIRANQFCILNNLNCITNVYDSVKKLRDNNLDINTADKSHPSPVLNQEVSKMIVNFINQN